MSNTKQRIQLYKRTRQLINRKFHGDLPMPVIILNSTDPDLYIGTSDQIAEYAVGFFSIIFPSDFDFTNWSKVDSYILLHLRIIDASIHVTI